MKKKLFEGLLQGVRDMNAIEAGRMKAPRVRTYAKDAKGIRLVSDERDVYVVTGPDGKVRTTKRRPAKKARSRAKKRRS